MQPNNVIVIMTDELRRDSLGCYGNPIVQTPNIDALAAAGTRFDNAYTPSPICVPARAAMATGKYVHETGHWGNAQPYHGEPKSWHHTIRDAGRDMPSIGKLHFRSTQDDNGFSAEIKPLHVKDGKGWVHGLLRDQPGLFIPDGFAANIGAGDDGYSRFDETVCDETISWLQRKSGISSDDPWGLYVSFLRPHYPLTCPQEYYDLYDPKTVPAPKPLITGSGADHPILNGMREDCNFDAPFTAETRNIAVASYYGLCSFVDHLVGQIVETLCETGLDKTTTIIFSSDHGECLGDRGIWTKMVMYEESVAVPLIVYGPNTPSGVSNAPVSLIDLHPTLLEMTGVENANPTKHAVSLVKTIEAPDMDRPILSEYHDYGARTGMFMLRKGKWKLVVYPGYRSQLFDLEADPGEDRDLGLESEFDDVIAELTREMSEIAGPDEVNARAFADQADTIERLGGRDAILAMQNYDHTPVE